MDIPCRFCLEMGHSVELESSERNMLQVLMPNIDLDIVEESRICEKCLEILHISYGFKESFLRRNERPKRRKLRSETSDNTNENTCLFCIAQGLEVLSEEESSNLKETVTKCFPDIDYQDKSCICVSCFSTLKDLYTFTKKCLATEVLISEFANSDSKVMLRKVKSKVQPKSNTENDGPGEPSEVADASTRLCISTNELKTLIGSNDTDTSSDRMLREEDCKKPLMQVQNIEDDDTVPNTTKRERPKQKKPMATTTFPCTECDYVAKQRHALKNHSLRHKDLSEVTMFKCTECSHETKRRGDLKAHMKIHLDPETLPLFRCANCPYFSKRKCDLKQHVIVHMKPMFKCKLCPYTTNNQVYLNTFHAALHKDISESEIFSCTLCEFQSRRKHDIKRHMKDKHINKEVITFKCNWCEFSSMYKQGLRNHMLLHKSKSELDVFKCDSCEYETIRKRDLVNHIFSRHKSVPRQMFECAHCPFKTAIKQNLKKHLQLHKKNSSDFVTYSCDLCGFKSHYKGSIKQHKISHARKTIKENITNTINPNNTIQVQVNSLNMELAD